MVKELSDKHLAAINRGRKAVGLKAIRRKSDPRNFTSTAKYLIKDDKLKQSAQFKQVAAKIKKLNQGIDKDLKKKKKTKNRKTQKRR